MNQELAVVFDQLADPRHRHNVRHPLPDLRFIALATVLCGGETCADMELFAQSKRDFLETFLDLRHGVPSHDTFSRVWRLLNPAAFEQWFITCIQQFAASLPPGTARPCGGLTTGAPGKLPCTWSTPGPKSSGCAWGR